MTAIWQRAAKSRKTPFPSRTPQSAVTAVSSPRVLERKSSVHLSRFVAYTTHRLFVHVIPGLAYLIAAALEGEPHGERL